MLFILVRCGQLLNEFTNLKNNLILTEMKKFITLLTLFLIMVNIHGQQNLKQNPTKDFFLQKSKNQKTAGWVLLLSGTAMTVGGSIAFNNSWDSDSYKTTDIYGFITLGGVVADLASIPFFISSGINKRKAGSMEFNFQNFTPNHKKTFFSYSISSATLRIYF